MKNTSIAAFAGVVMAISNPGIAAESRASLIGSPQPLITKVQSSTSGTGSESVYSGRIVIPVHITVSSANPDTATITCVGVVSVQGYNPSTGGSENKEELANFVAERSGTSATCRIVIHYSWTLAAPQYDAVTVSVNLLANDPSGYTRQSLGAFSQQIPLPATGTDTVISTPHFVL